MKIFLSYGHDNAAEALVLRIKADLAHLGHEVWLDRERIEFGDDWRREVTEGIIESDHVLAFLSEHSTRDPGVCRDEIAIALGAGKAYVFTILVQPEVDVSLPISVSHLQWLDMHDWQARQQADLEAFEAWYAEGFAQICAVIDHPDNQRFAGEISQLEEYLLPLDCTPDINSRLPGFTGRQWLLDEINTWREGDRSSRIFCLSGGPGMGKSAVVAWLAHSNKAQVIAAQFCRYNSPERRDPTRVIRSIAFQLATRLPDYRRHLLNQPEIKDLDRKNPVDLFDYLLANPLRYAINGNRPRQLIVIDALDETLQNGQSELTDLIASQLNKLPDWLGWVVTSRPESAIRGQLEQFGLHDINADDPRNQEDVETYIQHWLSTLGLEDAELLQAQQQILSAAQGNFLYVRQLQAAMQQKIIDIKQLNDLPKGLSALYLREFKYRYPDTHHYEQELLPVLEILVASSRPIPTSDIETLLNYSKRQRAKVIERLGSYLTVTEQGVALFHKSLQDWLLDENSAGADYFVEVEKGHQVLGEVLWEQFTQTEDLVSCLDSFMALELPEQLKHWSDEALLKIIDQDAVKKYCENILNLIDLRILPFQRHEQQESWGWLVIRLSELRYGIEHRNTAICLRDFAEYLRYIANFKGAEDLAKRALLIAEKVLGYDHRKTISYLNNLAMLKEAIDDYDAAETLYRRAILIAEQYWGLDHFNTCTYLNNLANLLKDRGDYESAEPLYQRVLNIEQFLGSDHLDTAVTLSGLAMLLKDKGDYDVAEPLYRRALEITEKSLGHDHPITSKRLNNLAVFLMKMARYDEAESLFWRALAITEHSFGLDHPETGRMLDGLAHILSVKGDNDKAELFCRRALIITEQVYGKNHSQTAIRLNNLSGLLYDKGDEGAAVDLCRRSIEIAESSFGQNHPTTGIFLNRLGVYLKNRKEYEEAEKLLVRSLSIVELTCGQDHPDVGNRLHNLASMLIAKGNYDAAEPLIRRSLFITEKSYGTDHPETCGATDQLAKILKYKGNYNESEKLYRQALNISENLFGTDHVDTARQLNNLGTCLMDAGDFHAAEPFFRRALVIVEKVNDSNDNTRRSILNLAECLDNIGDGEEAEKLFRIELAICEASLGKENDETQLSLHYFGVFLDDHNKFDEAENILREVVDLREKLLGPDSLELANSLAALGLVLAHKGEIEEASSVYQKALSINIEALGENHAETEYVRERIFSLQTNSVIMKYKK